MYLMVVCSSVLVPELSQDLLPQLSVLPTVSSSFKMPVLSMHGEESDDDLFASNETDNDWTDEESDNVFLEEDEWSDDNDAFELHMDSFRFVIGF